MRLFALHGISVPARCGGVGSCGKCKIKLLSGKLKGGETEADIYSACKAEPLTDCEILIYGEVGRGLETSVFTRRIRSCGEGAGIAVDLGTTTIAAALVDLGSGTVEKTISCLNPQAVFGSDVLSRIRACGRKENFTVLTSCVREAIGQLTAELLPHAKGRALQRMSVAGNTTMLHLLCGVDPSPLGVAPFTPAFTRMRKYCGEELGLPVPDVCILPSVAAFVGADITADMLAADFLNLHDTVLLVDLGTNGELAIKCKNRIVCTSTAAGPALEGACIECGTGGVRGAIDRVWEENGKLAFSTVEGAPPVGICGAGLIDLIAVLLNRSEIDETGYLVTEKCELCDGVFLSRADVRQFQLAKSAVAAGIFALLHRVGISASKVSRLLIAGGLGNYMNVKNAAKTGLIPKELERVSHAVGNGSLYGAQLALADPSLCAEATAIADRAEAIDLSDDACFADEFIRRMWFEELS